MQLVFWKKKTGPLPNWAWGGLIGGGAIAVASWRRNKAAGAKSDQEDTSSSDLQLPDSVQPTYAFVDADTTNITVQPSPAGGGRPPVSTLPAPVDNKPKPPPPPPVPPKPKPPAAPKGKYVTVVKWTAKNPPWNSTVWGIATHLLGPKASWQSVWNAPQNAALKKKRGAPEKIQPGDKIWVPGAK